MNQPACLRRFLTAGLAMCAFAAMSEQAQAFEPDPFDFGDVTVGEVSPSQAFVFTNTLPDPVTVISLEIIGAGSDQFSLVETDCAGVVPPAGSCEVVTAFAPTQSGSANALILMGFQVALGLPVERVDATITGNGVDAPEPSADLALDLSLNATEVGPGDALTLTGAIDNLGSHDAQAVEVAISLPAGVSGIAAAGAGWNCGIANETVTCLRATLAVLGSAPLEVQFNAPQAAGGFEISGIVFSDTPDPNVVNNEDAVQFTVVVDVPPPPPPPPPQPQPIHVPTLGPSVLLTLGICFMLLAWIKRDR